MGDEVQGDDIEWLHGGVIWDAIGWGFLFCGAYLALLTVGAPCNVPFHPYVHSWPPEVLCNEGDGVIPSWMASCR